MPVALALLSYVTIPSMPIIPLHLHSQWSLLDGVPSIREIVNFAQTLGLPALALTDSNALYGVMEFASCCREAGIHPIIGAELTITGRHHIVLLAQNREGYANLCRLITRCKPHPIAKPPWRAACRRLTWLRIPPA